MLYLLFISYTILFCWLISRLSFFKKTGLGSRLLISLFLIRIIASLVGCYFNLYYYPFSDTLFFHKEGIVEYEMLFKDPSAYFTNIFIEISSQGVAYFYQFNSSGNNRQSVRIITRQVRIG